MGICVDKLPTISGQNLKNDKNRLTVFLICTAVMTSRYIDDYSDPMPLSSMQPRVNVDPRKIKLKLYCRGTSCDYVFHISCFVKAL